ncbi:MAG TPA: HEPN domain-containing protein [Acidimicrobiales bacterium]|nr:HEPN domain-containing protein [Acidimicrobiales bacterium]
MLDDEEFRRWRAEAAGALQAGGQTRRGGQHNWACFLAEQAAQLAVKAFLHGVGAGPWGHDLVALGRALSEAVGRPLPPVVEGAVARLSKLYITTRCPDAHPGGWPGERYSDEEAARALEDAELVVATVDDLWRQLQA